MNITGALPVAPVAQADDELQIPAFLRRADPNAAPPAPEPVAPIPPSVPVAVAPSETPLDIGELAGKYVKLRDKIKEIGEKHTLELKPYVDMKAKLDSILLGALEKANVKSMRTGGGTISSLDKATFSLEDAHSFREYATGCQLWDLMNISANGPAAEKFLADYQQLPPGVKVSRFRQLSVRRPSASAADDT